MHRTQHVVTQLRSAYISPTRGLTLHVGVIVVLLLVIGCASTHDHRDRIRMQSLDLGGLEHR